MVSYVAQDGPGQGRGYYVHNGKGVGHDRKAAEAMEDGHYTLIIDGVDHDNPTSTSQTFGPEELADGSDLFVEVREGRVSIGEAPEGGSDGEALRLETDSNNGRLRFTTLYVWHCHILSHEDNEMMRPFFVEEETSAAHHDWFA